MVTCGLMLSASEDSAVCVLLAKRPLSLTLRLEDETIPLDGADVDAVLLRFPDGDDSERWRPWDDGEDFTNFDRSFEAIYTGLSRANPTAQELQRPSVAFNVRQWPEEPSYKSHMS